jgi:AcrR family transcriptional regulator
MDQGIDAVTIKSVAQRAGVSRQWLYEFFPDLDAILTALYQESIVKIFSQESDGEPQAWDFGTYMKQRSQLILDMAPAYAIVTSFALNGGAHRGSSGAKLRELIISRLERAWVQPLEARGFSRAEVLGSILTVTNAALGLNIAVHEGLTTYSVAQRRLVAVVGAIVTDSALVH